jgi:hypothetical protein
VKNHNDFIRVQKSFGKVENVLDFLLELGYIVSVGDEGPRKVGSNVLLF